jgi:hypothetical protein
VVICFCLEFDSQYKQNSNQNFSQIVSQIPGQLTSAIVYSTCMIMVFGISFHFFRKVQQEEKESRVQTAKPHKPHSGEEITMANPCVMHVAFITNYIV